MECPVCYCNTVNCTLICGHSFCRQCIKSWYQKETHSPTCPMCRHHLYFRGMRKYIEQWDEDAFNHARQEAFEEALEIILDNSTANIEYNRFEARADSESDSDSDSDGSWETWSSCWSYEPPDTRVSNIRLIEQRLNMYRDVIFDADDLTSPYFEEDNRCTTFWYEDVIIKNLFVSKHKAKPRTVCRMGARTRPMGILAV